MTALVAAAQRGAADVVQYLLGHQADAMVTGDEGAAGERGQGKGEREKGRGRGQ